MTDLMPQLGETEISPAPDSQKHRSALLKREMPGLDVLRGIAVLSVVLRHAFSLSPAQITSRGVQLLISGFRFGWLGVDLFFVLSGFLITGILIDTRSRENYWRSFYVRRALRILPIYLLLLALLHFVSDVRWLYLVLCLFFLANLAENRGFAVYNPLWSLAVEEQFYLFWPSLVRILRLRTLALLCIASIVISPFLRGLATILPLGNPYDATWLITDPLSLGALIAIFLRSRYSSAQNVHRLSIFLIFLSVILGATGWRLHLFSRVTHAGTAFQTEPFLFFFGFLLLMALRFGDRPDVLRFTRVFRFYGYISYGLYLLHLLCFGAVDHIMSHLQMTPAQPTASFLIERFIAGLASATLICYFSRRYFEEYFLRFKDRLVPYSRPKRLLK